MCTLNAPGCWLNDILQAEYGVYNKMEAVYDKNGGKVVDSKPDLIKSLQLDPIGDPEGVQP
jgi:hypothetical protein